MRKDEIFFAPLLAPQSRSGFNIHRSWPIFLMRMSYSSRVASSITPIPQYTARHLRHRLGKAQSKERYSTASSRFEPLCIIRHNSSGILDSRSHTQYRRFPSRFSLFLPQAGTQMRIDCSTRPNEMPREPPGARCKRLGLRLLVENYERIAWYVDNLTADGYWDSGMRRLSHRFCNSAT